MSELSNYGIPYMGSKSKIVTELIKVFPKATNFYDLFGGGFSVTHAMLRHRYKNYEQFHFNEIRSGVCDLIQDAISGKYNYKKFKPTFITKKEFHKNKDKDVYIKLLWSFGNNGKTYLFGENIESYKHSMHNAVVFNKFDDLAKEVLGIDCFAEGFSVKDRRLFLLNKAKSFKTGGSDYELSPQKSPKRIEELEQLERLERLQRLQQLEQNKIQFTNLSFEKVNIKKDSVIYCDVPYQNTGEYDGNVSFDRKTFLDWADNLKHPVFISEYKLDDPRFKCIMVNNKTSLLKATAKHLKKEKVYVNRVGFMALLNQRRRSH